MNLFLLQNTCASESGRIVLFQIYDAQGQPCACAEQLSGLFHDGFRVAGALPQLALDVRVAAARLPGGMIYTVYTGTRRRSRLSMLRDQIRVELDGLPCALLGTPATGEYTLTDARGDVLFSQQRCAGPNGRNTFLLSVPDEARADVYLGLAVCLSRLLAHPKGKFAPAPAGF